MAIRISKKQSIVLASCMVALFFIVTFLLIRSQNVSNVALQQRSPTPTVALPVATELPEMGASTLLMNEFHRSETKNGKKVWEVKGSQGKFFPESNSVRVNDATLWVFKEDGKVIQLETKEALLHLVGASLTTAEASSGVKLTYNNQLVVEADKATYDQIKETVHAPGPVRILSDRMDIFGNDLTVNVKTREMNLANKVESVLKARKGNNGTE